MAIIFLIMQKPLSIFFFNFTYFKKFLHSSKFKHKLKPQCNEIRSKSKPNFQPQVIYFTQIILTFGITGRLEYYKQRRE